MKNIWIFFLTFLALVSCDDKLSPDSLYTFKETNIAEYFRDNPDFSIFYKFLQISYNTPNKNSSTVASLLGTVGNYTVFAPKNDAMRIYLDSLYGENNYLIDTISKETANRVVLNSIIDMGTYKPLKQAKLFEGTIDDPTLDNHHLIVHWTDNGSCIINGKGKIISKFDIELYNGVIHIVDHVLPPAPNTVSGIIAEAEHLRIFNHLLEITSWADSMLLFEDKNYKPTRQEKFTEPKHRLYGYTAFVEADSIFAKDWGVPMPIKDENDGHIVNMEKIMEIITKKCREAYPDATDSDWKSKNNAINRFVSYHLLDIKSTYEEFVPKFSLGNGSSGIPETNTWIYYKTRGTTRLLKPLYVAKDGFLYLNRHCGYDNTFLGDYHETYCDYEGVKVYKANDYLENYAINGYYWLINHVLLYDAYTKNVVLNERIRYILCNNLPEIVNGRYHVYINNQKHTFSIQPNYCNNLITGKSYVYYNANSTLSWYGNLMSFPNPTDSHPIYYKLLPVPFSGNWELRISPKTDEDIITRIWIGTTTQVNKMKDLGIFHFHTTEKTVTQQGDIVRSYPVFLRDSDLDNDSIFCQENDKQLKLQGRMKAPNFFFSMRNKGYAQRFILSRIHLEADKEYWIRFQLRTAHTFELDGFELVPESIYANPNPDKAEDIW